MSTVYFPAIIERSSDGFCVFFPDLPGCTSAGITVQLAAVNAEEALCMHLLAMVEDNEIIPNPADLDTIERDPEVDEVARLLVRAELPGRKIRVNVMMDEGLLSAIDKVDQNRSRFVDTAVRAALAGR